MIEMSFGAAFQRFHLKIKENLLPQRGFPIETVKICENLMYRLLHLLL